MLILDFHICLHRIKSVKSGEVNHQLVASLLVAASRDGIIESWISKVSALHWGNHSGRSAVGIQHATERVFLFCVLRPNHPDLFVGNRGIFLPGKAAWAWSWLLTCVCSSKVIANASSCISIHSALHLHGVRTHIYSLRLRSGTKT